MVTHQVVEVDAPVDAQCGVVVGERSLLDGELINALADRAKRTDPGAPHDLGGLEVLGVGIAPAFTERMTFTDLERIQFDHQAPPGTTERTGVNGWYELAEVADGTRLRTTMEVCADLPLPRISSPAVTATMKRVMATMGDRFSRNLLDHLGVRS